MTTWTVPATVLRVVDGDTLEVLLDLGWHITLKSKLRLAGVNCPEMKTPAGPLARNFTENSLWDLTGPSEDGGSNGSFYPVMVHSHSLDKYGRILGAVVWWDSKGASHDLSVDLLAAGHAVPM